MNFLILPGFNGSGALHWQTLWQNQNPEYVRVQDLDFAQPRLERWLHNLESALIAQPGPVVLIAHSLACHQVAHFASLKAAGFDKIAGAFLVAPPDPGLPIFPTQAQDFLPLSLQPLGFPCLVVSSTNDPYGSSAFAKECARIWGAEHFCAGPLGHINAESFIDDWPAGKQILQGWISKGVPLGS